MFTQIFKHKHHLQTNYGMIHTVNKDRGERGTMRKRVDFWLISDQLFSPAYERNGQFENVNDRFIIGLIALSS